MRIVSGASGLMEAAKVLSEGGIVAYPTDTFYGLAVDAHSSMALRKLKVLKGRSEGKPFPVLLPDRPSLYSYTQDVPRAAVLLAERYWPGPLTIILKSRNFPLELVDPQGGVGFRVSSHPLAIELPRLLGRCITATSANFSGQVPAVSAKEVKRDFADADILVLDGGDTPGGDPSTIVDLARSFQPRLIREGAIAWEDIEACLGI